MNADAESSGGRCLTACMNNDWVRERYATLYGETMTAVAKMRSFHILRVLSDDTVVAVDDYDHW